MTEWMNEWTRVVETGLYYHKRHAIYSAVLQKKTKRKKYGSAMVYKTLMVHWLSYTPCLKKRPHIIFWITPSQYIGEVGKFIILKCQISRGYCVPKIIQFRWFLTELFKKYEDFLRHSVLRLFRDCQWLVMLRYHFCNFDTISIWYLQNTVILISILSM